MSVPGWMKVAVPQTTPESLMSEGVLYDQVPGGDGSVVSAPVGDQVAPKVPAAAL